MRFYIACRCAAGTLGQIITINYKKEKEYKMKNTAFKHGIIENNYDNKKLFSPKICEIGVECGCGKTNFDVIITHNADFGRIYDRFEKKCVFCGQDIRVEFNFNI